MVTNLKIALVTTITFSCLYPCAAPADTKQDASLEILWERVLSDPKHIQNNIDYGIKAKSLGHYQRAISAYRRVLKVDPTNGDALSNLEALHSLTRPEETSGTLITTTSYNANSGQSRRNARSDTALAKTLLIADDRRFLGTRWNSSVVNFADAHSFLRDSDVIFSSLKSGPTWLISSKRTLSLAAVFDHTYIDKRTDNFALGFTGNYITDGQSLKSVNTTLKYTKGVNEGDISYVNLGISFFLKISNNLLFKNDYLALEPSFSINWNKGGFDGSGQRDRLAETNGSLTYTVALTEKQSLDVFKALQYTYHFKHRAVDPRDREDLVHNIGFSYNYRLRDNVSSSLGVVREQKVSNFNEFHYVNYTTSLSLIFSF